MFEDCEPLDPWGVFGVGWWWCLNGVELNQIGRILNYWRQMKDLMVISLYVQKQRCFSRSNPEMKV